MGSKEDQIEMAMMMEKNELGLGHLYKTYANKLPEFEEFWNQFSENKRGHAFLVRTLRTLIEDGTVEYEDRPIKAEHIKAYIEDLNQHLSYAMRNEITIIEALSVGLELESRMLGKEFYEVYDSDPDELKRTLNTLNIDTQSHFETIKELYDEQMGK